MDGETHQVMTRGIQTENGAIQHVRNPGEWMPITRIIGLERPENARPCQAMIDLGVFDDVNGIINIDELVGSEREVTKNRQGRQRQRKPNHERFVLRVQGY